MAEGGLELGLEAGGEDIAGAGDEHGHPVGDHPTSQAEAASTVRQEPSLIAMTASRPRSISTTAWVTSPPSMQWGATLGQAGQPGDDGGELVGFRPVQAVGDRDRQPVGRHHHRVGHPWVRWAKLPTSQLRSRASILSCGWRS